MITRLSGSRLKSRLSTVGVACALGILHFTPALGQQSSTVTESPGKGQDSRGSVALEEVVVSARRVDERALTVPIAVTAVSGEDLERQRIRLSSDLETLVPALRTEFDPGSRDQFMVRGVGRTFGGAPGVVTYFAEVPQSFIAGPPLFDMASVQVLKGPQGTLFGKNSTGGAVLFTPQRPTDKFEGLVSAGAGNYSALEFSGTLNVPLGDTLRVRAAARHAEHDGYQENISGPDFNDEDKTEWRVSILFTPTSWLENYTIVDGLDSDGRSSQVILRAINPAAPLGALYSPPFSDLFGASSLADELAAQDALGIERLDRGNFPESSDETSGVANHTTIHAGNFVIKNIISYRDTETLATNDLDATTNVELHFTGSPSSHEFTEELQVRRPAFGNKLEWFIGGFYSDASSRSSNSSMSFLDLPFLAGQTASSSDEDSESKALFASVSYDLSNLVTGLKISAGYRYTWDQVDVASRATTGPVGNPGLICRYVNPDGTAFPGTDLATCTRVRGLESSDPNWNIDLGYTITDDLFVYAAARAGYKAAGFNAGSSQLQFTTYDPETINDFEIGIKNRGRIGTMPYRVAVALYDARYDDQQTLQQRITPDNRAEVVIVNADESRIRGGELELIVEPLSGLELSTFYGYTDAKYGHYVLEVTSPDDIADLSGKQHIGVPKETAGGTMRFTFSPGELGTFSFSGSATYRSEVVIDYKQPLDFITSPSYTVYDATAEWISVCGSNLDVLVYGKNLSDKLVKLWGFNALGTLGTGILYYSNPRTYGVQLSYRF